MVKSDLYHMWHKRSTGIENRPAERINQSSILNVGIGNLAAALAALEAAETSAAKKKGEGKSINALIRDDRVLDDTHTPQQTSSPSPPPRMWTAFMDSVVCNLLVSIQDL